MNTPLLNQLVPRGLYHVGEKTFDSKILAILDGTERNIHPTWNFYDDHFSKFDWTQEPTQSLEQLYHIRCQQIRDKYDYIVLHYSGGSDSNNILHHFWKYGIYIDEILTAQPLDYYEKFTVSTLDRSAANLHNEWFNVTKPDLVWIKEHMPNTKITVYDYTHDMLDFKVDQDWIIHAGEHCNPNLVNRVNRYTAIDIDVYNKKTVGHIYGIDKPIVFENDGHWWFSFLDSVLSIQSSSKPTFDKHNHVNVENFYWSADLPDLLIKQAHAVKNFFIAKPDVRYLATHRKKSFEDRENYQNIIREVIYPFWRNSIYQTKKSSNVFFKEFDQWFFKMATPTAIGRWQEGYNFLINSVENKWINFDNNNNPSGLMGMYSKWHKLL
jgi:hypothetical protein